MRTTLAAVLLVLASVSATACVGEADDDWDERAADDEAARGDKLADGDRRAPLPTSVRATVPHATLRRR